MTLSKFPPSAARASALQPRRRALCHLGSTALSLLAWPLAARSQTTPVSGAALAQAVLDRPAGDDATSLITMSLGEAGRPGRTRQLVSYRATPATGRSTTLIRFLAPRDIAGTGLLSLSDGKGRTDQSLYLPALAKVRRIASDRRGGRFVGSDIFFEDLQERQVDQDTHTLQGRTQLDGVECHVLQSNPVDGDDSVYRQRLSWVDVQTLVVRRVDYVERDAAAPTKRLEVLKVQQIQGLWTVMDSVVTDLTSGHQTRMQVERIQYNRRLPGKLFTPRALSDEGLEAEYRP